jgi:tetratricopeptide (TPR) repeat protein
LIDYFSDLRKDLIDDEGLYARITGNDGPAQLGKLLPLEDYVVPNVFTSSGSVDLIRAGQFGPGFADHVGSFPWADFYANYPRVFRILQELIASKYAFCLIDSRTGLTDTSGICTMLMPEKLVAVFTPNVQSLEGVVDLLRESLAYRSASNDLRPLAIFPLASRVENVQKLQEAWRGRYQSAFEKLFGDESTGEVPNLTAYFNRALLPHKSDYAFGEMIAITEEKFSESGSLRKAYEEFFEILSHYEVPWERPEGVGLGTDPSSPETLPDVLPPGRSARHRPVHRIFISSTAVDLLGYREKVRDAILRLEHLPVAIETFSAQAGQPVAECLRLAADADAVICIVAHRYGYVPPTDLGGDGERSITWLEVDAARRAGKPVFAFLVDPKAPWSAVREQDRLLTERDKSAEILKAIDKLQEFKTWLERETTRQTFTTPDDLATHVTAALSHFTSKPGRAPEPTTRVWQPLFCHALQPAQHFRGRSAKLDELKDWLQAPVTPDRVICVVAAGGTGKTALVNEALHQAEFSNRGGVFVWSFYEDPHTDAFLREAYLYFTGDKDAPASGMLERLQRALSGDAPHVLILDGLERVQSEGDHRQRGEFEDLQMKRLLRALAGGLGSARALATSRFPLVDLNEFTGAGCRVIALDDLERSVALEVLRAWNVKGNDAALTKLIEPLNVGGTYHALSVAIFGSYIGNFANEAPEFSLQDARDSDPKARRLSRILEQYAKALTPAERDLLARLSLFPRGVKVELLSWIVQSGGAVAGALVGLADRGLVRQLERLKALGLVFRYETDGQIVYSAHPFLREFFRNLLDTNPESIHESVRAKLAPTLQPKPKTKPNDPAILDQYELLIEETLLAGRVQEAFDLYMYGLGGYRNLDWVLGENDRGLRVVERFVPQDDFSRNEARLSRRDRSVLVNDLGSYAKNLGDLARARAAFSHTLGLEASAYDQRSESGYSNLAELELHAGFFPRALECSDSAVSLAVETKDDEHLRYSLAYRGASHFALGSITAAAADFQRAAELEGKSLHSGRGIREAESKLLRGDQAGAVRQTQANREWSLRNNYGDTLCRANALLALLILADEPAKAAQHLQDARAFANRSGNVELQLRCAHAATELYTHLGDYPQAIAEADGGILLADTCGFGKYSIDIRLALAETYLAAGDARKALQNARSALDRSEHPDCQYAWGRADGLHFCGVAHLLLGEHELARQRLTAALELRERLGHGRIEETRSQLAKII